jgi:hypothetical protein
VILPGVQSNFTPLNGEVKVNDIKKALQSSKAAMLLLATVSAFSLVTATVTPLSVSIAATPHSAVA